MLPKKQDETKKRMNPLVLFLISGGFFPLFLIPQKRTNGGSKVQSEGKGEIHQNKTERCCQDNLDTSQKMSLLNICCKNRRIPFPRTDCAALVRMQGRGGGGIKKSSLFCPRMHITICDIMLPPSLPFFPFSSRPNDASQASLSSVRTMFMLDQGQLAS